MKYLLALIVGIVTGAAAGVVLLYFNPLTQTGTASLPDEPLTFEYALPRGDALIVTHGGMSNLPRVPESVPELWESTIAKVGLNVLSLTGPDGRPHALASRVSVPSAATNLLLGGAIVTDYWLVTVPGEGSFFVHADNNLWPYLKDVVLPARYLGQALQANRSYSPTVGPAADRSAEVHGATGRFAAMTGKARASYRIEDFDETEGLRSALGQLHLDLDLLAPRSEDLNHAGLQ
jgi:hypothetical protein